MLADCGSVGSLGSHLADVLEASCFEIADCYRGSNCSGTGLVILSKRTVEEVVGM
jgi:hypothetical protein